MIVAVLLGASGCGGDGSSADSNEREGTYDVAVTAAAFPTSQVLGQTSLLKLKLKNEGDHTVPALAVTFTIAGGQGADSALAFAVHEPQKGLAMSDRPVWVLAQGYPQLAGANKPGGATTSNPKTFDLGPLEPGASRAAVWKLSAVRQGEYTLRYSVDAGLSGKAKAETTNGVAPGGTFVAEISAETPDTEVTDSGEIVEITQGGSKEGGK